MTDKRNSYRITYPPSERPSLTIGSALFQVFDLSETGALVAGAARLATNENFSGTVTFVSGEKYPVRGHVIRNIQLKVALHFDQGVPYKKIVAEQLRLKTKYIKS